MKRDEQTVAMAVALGVCVGVYIIGALLLAAVASILDFSKEASAVLSVILLIASMMAAVVVMLRDSSRRT